MLIGQRTELQFPFCAMASEARAVSCIAQAAAQCEKTLPGNGFHGQPRYYLLN